MNCPSCDGKNREDARFCKFCGTDLLSRCRMCGAILDEDARFCDACGTSVEERPAAPAPAAAVAAARKVVTVLFGDLSGSTALEERMDAESVRSILDRFYAAMRSEIERHGGRVVKFTGDGVMAAFGVPEVHEDDASRAVDAALAMRDELDELASDLQLELGLKIGINTGEVVVSAADDDVVGDAVNVASRLEGAAVRGEVLVGEETWRLTRGTSRYEPVEPLILKGKSEPVPAYRLLSVDERTADSAAAPFVGRDAELGRLLAAFQDAVDANAARLVTIIGSPGLGKTRLARELMSELTETARIRETRCDPAGGSTFAPITDALRAGSAFTDTSSEGEIVAALAARLPEDDPDRDRVAKLTAALFGVGVSGTTEETFWALRRIIEAAARQQPVVFVIDDIHWAEPLLFDLVEHLAEWIRDAPVLLVGTARPELRDLRPSLAEGGRAADVLALEGLDRAATAQLALNLLGAEELPGELLAKIPASTEGNPLFVRELVRMLVDDGVLQRTADGWNVTVDVDAIEVPPTISSLLSARVDRLRNDERTVIELASVIGKEFYRGALVDLAPTGVRELVDGCLESLRRKELVEPVGTYWIDEPVYRFHHALIRDAAYRRVLKERRAEVHENVAVWLENKTENVVGEHDELVGYHLEQAHEYKRQLGRPDDALGTRAAELLGAAALRALESDDLPAAAALSGRALDRLGMGDGTRAELLLIRCEALLSMGDVVQGALCVEEFGSLATTQRLRAWATCFVGQLENLTVPERLHDIETQVAAAAAELVELGDHSGAAKAYTVHASTLAGLGRFAECEAVLDLALTSARAADDRRRITATLGSAPHAALWGPNPVSRAGGRCLDIVRLLRITTGSPAVEATSLRCQAVLEAFRGRADAARRMLRSAQRTLTELGLQHELLETEQFSGIVELVAGDPAAAEAHLRAAHDGFRAVGVDVLAAQSAALLARAYLALGEDVEAETFVGTSAQLGSQDLKTAIAWRSVKAELLAHRGEFDEARALAQEAVDLAERTDALIDHGQACRSLGVVLRAAGDAAGAKGAEDRALALFERKGATALIVGAEDVGAEIPAGRTQGIAPTSETRELQPNACVTLTFGFAEMFERRDWRSIEEHCAERIVFDDRRVGFDTLIVGPAACVEQWKTVAAVGATCVRFTTIATRGEHLALVSGVWRGPDDDSWEVEALHVCEVDHAGQWLAVVTFDPARVDNAFAELDERYILGEGSQAAQIVRMWAGFHQRYNARDWAALREQLADDFVAIDHRLVSLGQMDADSYVRAMQGLIDLDPGRSGHTASIAVSDADGGVATFVTNGMTSDGVVTAETMHMVAVVVDGRFARHELYTVNQLEPALRRFDELTAAQRAPGSVMLANAATVTNDRIGHALAARDWAAIERLVSENVVFVDRRRGLQHEAHGRGAFMELMKAIPTIGTYRFGAEVLAVRGDRHMLALLTTVGPDGRPTTLQTQFLSVQTCDAEGRLAQMTNLDTDDLDAAFAELDERYANGEGAEQAEAIRFSAALAHATNDPTGAALRPLTHEDVVLVDHRPASFGEVSGLDEFLRLQRSWSALFDVRHAFVSRRIAEAPDRALGETRIYGTSREGAPVDTSRLVLAVFDEKVSRIEYFQLDQEAQALARFHELGPRPDVHTLENSATRFVRRLRETMNSNTLDEFLALHSPSFTLDDRRAGLRHVTRGLDEIREYWVSSRSEGLGHFEVDETLAIRGDRLVLSRRVYTATQDGVDFDSEQLVIDEIDESERVVGAVFFDPDDLDAAFDELDARFLAGEGADAADVVDLCARLIRALNARDWAGVRGMLTDDLVVSDHRPASLGVMGLDEYIASQKPLYEELVPDFRLRSTRVLAFAADRLVVVLRGFGTRDGADVEISLIGLAVARNGRFSRIEFFPLEHLDLALERSDELGPRPDVASPPSLENLATRTWDAMCATFAERRWDAHAQRLAEDVVSEDRRPGLRNTQTGRRAFIDVAKLIASFDPVLQTDVLAVRGDRLALIHETYVPAADDPRNALVEIVNLVEVDADGLVVRTSAFEPEAVDDAFDELDRCFLAGEGSSYAEALRIVFEQAKAYNARDWTAYTAVQADDHVFVDHRPAGAGTLVGGPAQVRYLQGMMELAPDVGGRIVEVAPVASDRVLTRLPVRGTTHEGAVVEMAMYVLYVLRDGRICRQEAFPIEGRDAALERFGELGPQPDAPALENAAVRRIRMVIQAFGLRDWDFFIEHFPDDHVYIDRRAGLQTTFRGREQAIENLRQAAANGANQLGFETVAIRGERLALGRYRWVASDWDVEVLVLDEHDDHGRAVRSVVFDPSDLDAAFAELDERFIAGEGEPFAEILRNSAVQREALRSGDWATYAGLVDPDVVLIDNRPASLGEVHGREEVLRAVRALAPLVGGVRPRAGRIHAIAPDRMLLEAIASGTSEHGGNVEMRHLRLQQWREGRIVRIEMFPDSDIDHARARFDALGPQGVAGRSLENACTRHYERHQIAWSATDWDAMAGQIRPDVVVDDRRVGVANMVVGADDYLRNARVISDLGAALRTSTAAIRGERLALLELDWHDPSALSASALRILHVNELHEDGRLARIVVFDPEDRDAAFAELEERFIEGEGREAADAMQLGLRTIPVWNGQDLEALEAVLAPDYVFIDHRPVTTGELDANGVIEIVKAGARLMPDVHHEIVAVTRWTSGMVLAQVVNTATNTGGGRVETAYLQIVCSSGGRFTRMERFAPDRYDDAVSRFEELAERSRSGMLDNACMRTTAHFVRRVIAREWEQARRIISDGFVGEDRRSGLGYNLGAAELIEMYRAMHELGLTTFDVAALATRGERIALMRAHVGATPQSGGEFTVELLALNELDEAGSIVGSVLFDPDDEDAAFAELDELYAGTLSGPEAELVRSVPAIFDAYNARDWDRFGDCINRDFVLVDHLPAAIGRIEGREDYVAYLRTMTELVPDARVRIIRDFALAPGTAMYELRLRGTSTDGVAVETAWIDVPEVVDGRVKRLDQYPIEAIESARSRFDKIRRAELLRSRDHPPPLVNEMTRHMESWTASWNRGEWDPETDLISETIVTDDRRSGLQYVLVGREAHIANLAAVRDIGAALRPEIIAIRGERLALFRFHWFDPTAGTDAIVEHLQLSGLDEHGRAALSMPFDLDDLDAAYAELDERYAETLGPRAAAVVRHGSQLLAAYNARDFERFRSLMVDELEVIDHRPVGTGAYAGADRFVDANRVHSEVIDNYRFRVIDIPEVADGVCLTRNLGTGTNSEGGAIELPSWGVWSWNAGARAFDLFEYFPLDTFDAALARFHELLSLRSDAGSRLENEAFRALRLLGSRVMDGDWDGVAALMADEAVWDDRRRGFGWRWEGKREVLRQLKAATPTRGRIEETAIATRGERLVLDHQRVAERGFEVEFTALYEIDATGLVTGCVLFDVDDLDGAFAELDERYASTLPPIPAQIVRMSADLFAAFNHRDWDRYRSHLAPDFVAIDRQHVGVGEIVGPDAMVSYAKGIIELLSDAREDLIAFHRIDDHGAVAEIRARGQNAEGGDVEFALIYVGLVDDGLGTRMETYPADRLDEALARYGELTAG